MSTKLRQWASIWSARKFNFFIILFLGMFAAQTAKAEIVELSITGSWSADDFKVTGASDLSYDPANPKFDGKVFGVVPSAGGATIHLRVNTGGNLFFPAGHTFVSKEGVTYTLAHDHYGYREVTLIKGPYIFGGAVWENSGIVAGLEAADGVKAALWTDADITRGNPQRLSFRMFGKAEGLTSDFFVGSRTPDQIGDQFLLWEYYLGEEIRSRNYSCSTRVLPD